MDKIRFELEYVAEADTHVYNMMYPLPVITHIYINDTDLLSLIREAELPYAIQEGHSELAGDYIGFKPSKMLWPSKHLLGDPEPHYKDKGKVVVYGCTCGEAFCWPMLVRVKIGKTSVSWSDFEQPHRGPDAVAGHWRYDTLGPFTFDRRQYENAVEIFW